jgi:hypothetical protein
MTPLDAITLDAELQPRAEIDRSVLENYVQLLVDGTTFPPVVVFRDDQTLWLADGFHRWHANKVLENEFIATDVRVGSRRDALLWSLSANASHGLQRASGDYSRAYETACRNELVDPCDVEAVAALLRCSGSWAEKLTAKARNAARATRDAEIIRLKDEGKTHRQVAEVLGLKSPQTVTDVVQKQHSAETGQAPSPFLSDAAKAKLRELAAPPAQNWSAALAALRLVNEQVSVDALFEGRFTGFDHVFGPQLEAAHEWINELHGRFVSEQAERRRA